MPTIDLLPLAAYLLRHQRNCAGRIAMRRPAGVVVLAVLYWIGTCGLLMVGLIMSIGSTAIGTALQQMGPLIAGLGAIGGFLLIGMGAVLALIGYGLFQMQEWARVTAMVFAGIGLVATLIGFFTPLGVSVIGRLFRIGVNALVLWYLNQPDVKGLFARR